MGSPRGKTSLLSELSTREYGVILDYRVPEARVCGVTTLLGRPQSSPAVGSQATSANSTAASAVGRRKRRQRELSLAELRSIACGRSPLVSRGALDPLGNAAQVDASLRQLIDSLPPDVQSCSSAAGSRPGTRGSTQRLKRPPVEPVLRRRSSSAPGVPRQRAGEPDESPVAKLFESPRSSEREDHARGTAEQTEERKIFRAPAPTVSSSKMRTFSPFAAFAADPDERGKQKVRWLVEHGAYMQARTEDLRREARLNEKFGLQIWNEPMFEAQPGVPNVKGCKPLGGGRRRCQASDAKNAKRSEMPYMKALKSLQKEIRQHAVDAEEASKEEKPRAAFHPALLLGLRAKSMATRDDSGW